MAVPVGAGRNFGRARLRSGHFPRFGQIGRRDNGLFVGFRGGSFSSRLGGERLRDKRRLGRGRGFLLFLFRRRRLFQHFGEAHRSFGGLEFQRRTNGNLFLQLRFRLGFGHHRRRLSHGWLRRRRLSRALLDRLFQKPLDGGKSVFRLGKRLFQPAVGPHAVGFLFIVGLERAGQQQDRDVSEFAVVLDVLAHLVAGAHRHENVRQHHVRADVRELAHGVLAVRHAHHFDPRALKHLGELPLNF